MRSARISKPTLGRLPVYLDYLEKTVSQSPTISATAVSRALGFGEVQVRKDLAAIGADGKPKVGYRTSELILRLKESLGRTSESRAIVVGAGRLGRALLDYDGFTDYGVSIAAAFDSAIGENRSERGRPIFPIDQMPAYCDQHDVHIGIITVSKESAQSACDALIKCHISAIWNFAPIALSVPPDILLKEENLALSLAYLNQSF